MTEGASRASIGARLVSCVREADTNKKPMRTSPMPRLFCLALLVALLAAAPAAAGAGTIEGEPRNIDLDTFIETQRPMMSGTKTILAPYNVSFRAVVKRGPEKIEVRYLFEAMSLMNVEPLPRVTHRMFVESRAGAIIPVYVEDQAVAMIARDAKEGSEARLRGYHVYNYSKGPAIVVDGVQSR